jgi:CheY-like chemotaxis protein
VILIVDDHLDSCEALKRLLGKVGYRSETCGSGAEALGFIRAVKPRLLVLDVMMPDMNGLEVLRAIRSDPELADIPVMMYSACDNNETVDEALKGGANDYILKSQTDWTDLLGRINEAYECGTKWTSDLGGGGTSDGAESAPIQAAAAGEAGPTVEKLRVRVHIEDVRESIRRAQARIERTRQILRKPPPRWMPVPASLRPNQRNISSS